MYSSFELDIPAEPYEVPDSVLKPKGKLTDCKVNSKTSPENVYDDIEVYQNREVSNNPFPDQDDNLYDDIVSCDNTTATENIYEEVGLLM